MSPGRGERIFRRAAAHSECKFCPRLCLRLRAIAHALRAAVARICLRYAAGTNALSLAIISRLMLAVVDEGYTAQLGGLNAHCFPATALPDGCYSCFIAGC